MRAVKRPIAGSGGLVVSADLSAPMSPEMWLFAATLERFVDLEAENFREHQDPALVAQYFLFDGRFKGTTCTLVAELPVFTTRFAEDQSPLTVVAGLALSVGATRFGTVLPADSSGHGLVRPSLAPDSRMLLSCVIGERGHWYAGQRPLAGHHGIHWSSIDLAAAMTSDWTRAFYSTIDELLWTGPQRPDEAMAGLGAEALQQWEGRLLRLNPVATAEPGVRSTARKAKARKKARRKNRR